MKRHRTVHVEPGEVIEGAPKDAVSIEFARKLQAEMVKKGWNQSELARKASIHMPDGQTMRRDTISLYINARNLPGANRLEALSKALGVAKDELLPSRGITASSRVSPPVDVREIGDGRVWLRVNQAVEWPEALKILDILKGSSAK